QQQDSSGDQTILWLSHLRSYGNSPLSHVGTPSGTGINPQILLRRRKNTGEGLAGLQQTGVKRFAPGWQADIHLIQSLARVVHHIVEDLRRILPNHFLASVNSYRYRHESHAAHAHLFQYVTRVLRTSTNDLLSFPLMRRMI